MRKFIVFESCLRSLLSICFLCCQPCRVVLQHVRGTLVIFKAICIEGHLRTWHSQPMSGPMPLGNLVVAASILFNGCSPVKALNMMRNIQMMTFSKWTYNRIQAYLLPAINSVWKNSQENLLKGLIGRDLTMGGDARCCSPGRTAKYGSYSCMELQSSKILDMELIQVNILNR